MRNYAIDQRLRFIDFLLHEYGAINLSALIGYFGISRPQASMDIREYMKIAPDNVEYDKSKKVYKRTPDFCRAWG